MFANISWLAVILATLANFFLGFFWYSDALYGKAWAKEMGLSTKGDKSGMGKLLALNLVATLVLSFVLAYLSDRLSVSSASAGAAFGFWLWLGFIGAVSYGRTLWGKDSMKLWFINNAYWLISLIIMGAIVGAM